MNIDSDRLLAQWISEGTPVRAIAAATESAGFGDAIAAWSERVTPETRAELIAILAARIPTSWQSAIALGRLRAVEHCAAIVRAFAASDQLATVGYAQALALLAQREHGPAVLRALEGKPKRAWPVHQALCAMYQRTPLLGAYTDGDSLARAVKNAWTRPALESPRIIAEPAGSSRHRAFALDHGAGRVRIEPLGYQGGAWPQWNRALTVDRAPLYAVSSGCDTCATIFSLSGSLDASRDAMARYRAGIRSVLSIDSALDAIEPLVHQLETGRYLASLVSVSLRPMRSAREGWLGDPDALETEGAVRYESAVVALAPQQSACFVLGTSQPDAITDASIVAMYADEIRAGSRPAALALCWLEERFEGGWDESTPLRTSALGLLLDGHHKLAAYAREGVAAPVLALTMLDQCSMPRERLQDTVVSVWNALSGPA